MSFLRLLPITNVPPPVFRRSRARSTFVDVHVRASQKLQYLVAKACQITGNCFGVMKNLLFCSPALDLLLNHLFPLLFIRELEDVLWYAVDGCVHSEHAGGEFVVELYVLG
jgi:hypothetical protein